MATPLLFPDRVFLGVAQVELEMEQGRPIWEAIQLSTALWTTTTGPEDTSDMEWMAQRLHRHFFPDPNEMLDIPDGMS